MSWKIYTSPRSPFVRKVMIAVHELGLDKHLVCQDVMTTPMTPAPELLTINPMGMIPTLVTDDFVLFDSLTILEFLNDAANGDLFTAGDARWENQSRHAMANAAMDKSVRILDEQFRTQNDDTIEHLAGYTAAIKHTVSWMEPRLVESRFDAGDICFAALLAYLDMRFPHISWRDGATHAAEWFANVSTRPSMIATAFAAVPAS